MNEDRPKIKQHTSGGGHQVIEIIGPFGPSKKDLIEGIKKYSDPEVVIIDEEEPVKVDHYTEWPSLDGNYSGIEKIVNMHKIKKHKEIIVRRNRRKAAKKSKQRNRRK